MAIGLSDANQKVLLLIFQATPPSGWPKPDMDRLMVLGGYKNRQSANGMYSYVMKQLRNAIEKAESGQANGAAGTMPDDENGSSSAKKTGKPSSGNKRAPKCSKIKAEPDDEVLGFPDLTTSTEATQDSARKTKDKDSSKKRKSAKDDENHGFPLAGAQIPAAQIPGAQVAFLNNQSSSSTHAHGKNTDHELASHVKSEPAQKKYKKSKARQDTPFGSPGSVANDRPASNQAVIDHPSPTRPSPASIQKLDDMLKYNGYLAETEQQRHMCEQIAIDFYGMSDEEN